MVTLQKDQKQKMMVGKKKQEVLGTSSGSSVAPGPKMVKSKNLSNLFLID